MQNYITELSCGMEIKGKEEISKCYYMGLRLPFGQVNLAKPVALEQTRERKDIVPPGERHNRSKGPGAKAKLEHVLLTHSLI